jgi:hypothetical protein
MSYGQGKGNTSRMNKLEELGRVDSERAGTAKGKRNLAAERSRIVKDLKRGSMRKKMRG